MDERSFGTLASDALALPEKCTNSGKSLDSIFRRKGDKLKS